MSKNYSNQTEILSVGVIKRLQKPYVATFYQKVVDLVSGIEAESLVDTIAVFTDTVSEFTNSLRNDIEVDPEEVAEAFRQLRMMWNGTHRIFQGHTRSVNPTEAAMATKALALLKRYRQEHLKRTNAGEQILALTTSITNAWSASELAGTCIEQWSTQLVTAANNFTTLYQRRVSRTRAHLSVSQYSAKLFEQFYFMFFSMYVYVGSTGDVAVSEIFENIRELIDIYGRINKAHATFVANRNKAKAEQENGTQSGNPTDESSTDETETPAEIDELLRQAASVGQPAAKAGDESVA